MVSGPQESLRSGLTEETDAAEEQPCVVFSFKGMCLALWGALPQLITANLCFLLFCIPVLTAPAALTALHGVCVDAVRGIKKPVFKKFVSAIRKDLLPALALFLILFLLLGMAVFGTQFYLQRGAENGLFIAVGIVTAVIAVLAFLMLPSAFVMLSITPLKIKQILKNAFLLAFLNLKFAVLGAVCTVALIAVQAAFCVRLVPFILLIGISLTVYLAAYMALYGLQRFVLTEKL